MKDLSKFRTGRTLHIQQSVCLSVCVSILAHHKSSQGYGRLGAGGCSFNTSYQVSVTEEAAFHGLAGGGGAGGVEGTGGTSCLP